MQDKTSSLLLRRTDEAYQFFNRLADQVIRSCAPARILIVGPVVGLLAEAFWDRGVEAHGECLDFQTVDDVRMDVKPFYSIGIGSRPIQSYDMAICINFLEWSKSPQFDTNIEYLKRCSASILFVSLAGNADDGQPELPFLDWIERLGRAALVPVTTFDLVFANANILLVEQNRKPLTSEHISDFVRMRKLMNSLRAAETMVVSARQESAALSQKVVGLENERAEAARQLAVSCRDEQILRLRLEQAINTIATAQVALEQTRSLASQRELEMVQHQRALAQHQLGVVQHQLEIARHDLQLTYWSSSWRLTRPLRAISRRVPGIVSLARQLAKLVFWSVTLQLPKRLKARRDFRRSQTRES